MGLEKERTSVYVVSVHKVIRYTDPIETITNLGIFKHTVYSLNMTSASFSNVTTVMMTSEDKKMSRYHTRNVT